MPLKQTCTWVVPVQRRMLFVPKSLVESSGFLFVTCDAALCSDALACAFRLFVPAPIQSVDRGTFY